MTEGVTHKEYTDARVSDLYRYVDACRTADLLLASVRDEKNSGAVTLAFDGAREATRVALDASEKAVLRHNGLIEMMRGMLADFINWRTAVSFIGGAAAAVAIYSQVTG